MEREFDFERDGCLLLRQVIPMPVLDALIAHIDGQIGQYADWLHARGEIEETHSDLSFETRLVALNRGTEERLRSWNNIAMSAALYHLICHPAIVDALTPILGRDFGFNGDYHVRPKLPNSTYTAFPWHQDSQYYGPQSQHARIITVWIPMVDVDERNGCLQVLPGSQEWGLLGGKRGRDMNMRSFEDVEKRGIKPVRLPMRKGDIFLFSNLTYHQSTVNLTDAVRWSVDIRYTRIIEKHALAPDVLASETFMRDQLAASRVPISLHGDSERIACADWISQLAKQGWSVPWAELAD